MTSCDGWLRGPAVRVALSDPFPERERDAASSALLHFGDAALCAQASACSQGALVSAFAGDRLVAD